MSALKHIWVLTYRYRNGHWTINRDCVVTAETHEHAKQLAFNHDPVEDWLTANHYTPASVRSTMLSRVIAMDPNPSGYIPEKINMLPSDQL